MPISLLIKPASSLCNLRCHYCFYHALSAVRSTPSYGLMDGHTLERIVSRAFDEADDLVTFAFQGGEPTLCGLPFYQQLIELVSRYNRRRLPVHYALQTNGQLIDAEWASFLGQHHFLVGLSLDGPRDLHDQMRVDARGHGSFRQVMQASALLDAHHVDYNILTVVTSRLARHADQIYRFYKKNQFRYLQFIPCLAPLGTDPVADPHALTASRYGQFLLRLFDLWYTDMVQGDPVSIRLFDNWVRMVSGERPEQCGLAGVCTSQMVIEADGSVYPCDFYVTDEWRLGSVHDHAFSELAAAPVARRFVEASCQVPDDCQACRWYRICRNGCRRDREPSTETGQNGLNHFCQAYKIFFDQAMPRLVQLARMWQLNRPSGPGPSDGPGAAAGPGGRD